MSRITQNPLVRLLATVIWFIAMLTFIISIPATICTGLLSLSTPTPTEIPGISLVLALVSGVILFLVWPISYIDI